MFHYLSEFFHKIASLIMYFSGFPCWVNGLESACQRRGHGFKPWSRKISHAAEQLSPCTMTAEPVCHNY